MYKKKCELGSRIVFAVVGILAIVFCIAANSNQKTPLAGKVQFPGIEYSEWLRNQMDSKIDDSDKIKSTINTYFELKYKSWMNMKMLDFGFLVDLSDDDAKEDYAYERGLFHLLLTGWRMYDNRIVSYDYQPNFMKLSVEKDHGEVQIHPLTYIIHARLKNHKSAGPWDEHTFVLIKINGRWLISKIICKDPVHNLHPHGSDFNKLADSLPERTRQSERYDEANLKKNSMRRERSLSAIKTPGIRNYLPWRAVQYARKYSSNTPGTASYNPLFLSYESDCASFVSQCIWNGYDGVNLVEPIENHSLPMIADGINAKTWWADSTGTSVWNTRYCWIRVADLIYMLTDNKAKNLIGPRASAVSVSRVYEGDIVKARDQSHVMFVYKVYEIWGDRIYWEEISICAHTTNRWDRFISDLYPSSSYCVFYTLWNMTVPD